MNVTDEHRGELRRSGIARVRDVVACRKNQGPILGLYLADAGRVCDALRESARDGYCGGHMLDELADMFAMREPWTTSDDGHDLYLLDVVQAGVVAAVLRMRLDCVCGECGGSGLTAAAQSSPAWSLLMKNGNDVRAAALLLTMWRCKVCGNHWNDQARDHCPHCGAMWAGVDVTDDMPTAAELGYEDLSAAVKCVGCGGSGTVTKDGAS